MPPPPTLGRNRSLGGACIALFTLSSAFPIIGSVIRTDQAPRWLGVADVAVAAALVCVAIVLASQTRRALTDRNRLTAFYATQAVIFAIPALLALFFLAGGRINWDVLVVGVAWRGWLLLYTLPHIAAALAGQSTE